MDLDILFGDPEWWIIGFGVNLVSAAEPATVDQIAHGTQHDLEDLGNFVDG